MKIEKYSNITTTFDNIEIGEVFEYDAHYFLKIATIIALGDIDYNSICISTGKAIWFSNDVKVIKVDAKLLINN